MPADPAYLVWPASHTSRDLGSQKLAPSGSEGLRAGKQPKVGLPPQPTFLLRWHFARPFILKIPYSPEVTHEPQP